MSEKTSREEALRDSLEEAVLICEALAKHCDKVEDMVSVMKLALENEGQFKILLNTITQGKR